MKRFATRILALWLALGLAALAQDVASINQAAAAFNALLGKGLEVSFTGEGKFSGNIFTMTLTNQGSEPMTVEMPAGMVMTPSEAGSQRMIVESAGSGPIAVAPGQTVEVTIRGFCLDSDKQPPAEGKVVDYAVASDVTPYRDAIRTVLAGLRLSNENRYGHEFLPTLQRTIVVQRAIWAQEPEPYTQDDLYIELEKEMANTESAEAAHAGDPMQLAQALWRDVQLTLRTAQE